MSERIVSHARQRAVWGGVGANPGRDILRVRRTQGWNTRDLMASSHDDGSAGLRITLFLGLILLLSVLVTETVVAAPVAPPATGRIEGRVVTAQRDAPLAGVHVSLQASDLGTTTDANGRFVLDDVPAGPYTIIFEHVGRRTERRSVRVSEDRTSVMDVRLEREAIRVDEVVVSVSGEAQGLARTAATVGVVRSDAIRERRPSHPSELMGQVPGVWVNVTGGEGHMTAIRQPLTTDPVYLYLEDGVPTRSTGFFNHNALYEVNLPQAERVEVVKGPVSALHGSDAIGGVVNAETRSAREAPGLEASLDTGPDGWTRLLGSYAFAGESTGLRADLNLTRTDGWREATSYDRQSATVRWDQELGERARLKSVIAWSRIDQQTAGSSQLPEAQYRDTPTKNLTPISYREVDALRVSAEYEREGEHTLWSVTPFARYNAMEILPNWSLSYDPATSETTSRSVGVMARARRDLEPLGARVVAGVDVDRTPGEHLEYRVDVDDADGVYTAYSPAEVIYDYDVTFTGISPYLHLEASPVERLRLTAGLRYDRLAYDYDNPLGVLEDGPHRRPASTRVAYAAASPKVGATLALGRATSIFASYARGFRAPSQGQLFRQGVASNTVGLEPVVAVNHEAGLRGLLGERASYQLSVYRMRKHDDILTFQRDDENRETQNAGATLHRGLEVGVAIDVLEGVRADIAFALARHRYESWRPEPTIDYGGNEMESAPRTLGNVTLLYRPGFAEGSSLALEWTHLGPYYLDADNEERYSGHDLLAVRALWPVGERVGLSARVSNLTNARFAENGGWSPFRGREFAPGRPRALFVGLQISPGDRR